MYIQISYSELLGEFKNCPDKVKQLYNLGLDYATNSLEGIFNQKEVCIFDFKNYGFITDNRYNSYKIFLEDDGILIHIINME